jgi:hypothetical protein
VRGTFEAFVGTNDTNDTVVVSTKVPLKGSEDRIPNLSCKIRIIRLKAEPTPRRLQNNLLWQDSLEGFVILRFDMKISLTGPMLHLN